MMRAFRLSLALGLLFTMAACASQNTGAGGNSGPPAAGGAGEGSSAAVSSTLLPRPTGGLPTQANQSAPDGRAVNLRPVKWTRAEAGEGKQLLVHYTVSGRVDCSVLGRIDVTESTAAVIVTVFLGQNPGKECGGVQPMIAADFVTTVTLRQPVGSRTVEDGAG